MQTLKLKPRSGGVFLILLKSRILTLVKGIDISVLDKTCEIIIIPLMTETLLTVIEIAEKFGVNIMTIYAWIRDGCPHEKKYKGRQHNYFLRLSAVQAWLNEQRQLAGEKK